jgi:hypothetical protein
VKLPIHYQKATVRHLARRPDFTVPKIEPGSLLEGLIKQIA